MRAVLKRMTNDLWEIKLTYEVRFFSKQDFEESYRRFQSRMKNKGLDQFTSLPPLSVDRQTLQGYPGRHADIIDQNPSLGIDTNIDKAGTPLLSFTLEVCTSCVSFLNIGICSRL